MSTIIAKSQKANHLTVKTPWVTFFFLTVIFFFSLYNFSISLMDIYQIPDETYVKAVSEGNIMRRLAFLTLGLFGVISILRKGLAGIRINGALGWLILFFLCWAFLSIAWADDISLTFRRLVVLSMLCLGVLAVSKNFSLRDIIWFTVFSTILYLIIGLSVEIFLGTFRPFAQGYRFTGTLNPNMQALNCALLFLSGVATAQKAKRGYKFFLACALTLIGLGFLILTGSRTAFACVIFSFISYWVMVSSRVSKLAFVLCLGFTFCLLLLFAGETFYPTLRQVILLGRESYTTYSLSGRIPLWKELLEYVAMNPFHGYGYQCFWNPRHIHEISTMQGWQVYGSHSVYVQLLLGVGIVGMVTYVLILIIGIVRSFLNYRACGRTGYAFIGALLVFCALDGLMEGAFFEPRLPTFIIWVALVQLAFKDLHAYNENNSNSRQISIY